MPIYDRDDNTFYDLAKDIMKHNSYSKTTGLRRFKSFFGVSAQICALSWEYIKLELSTDYRKSHLLWALLFLKSYDTESINHSIVGCDEKTFRKRVWTVIDKLAFMKVVIWENRKINANVGQSCLTSLDGVDFQINEPSPFSPIWFSHKFKSAGLRYEIGLCVRTGEIVWANGGYPCGSWPDLKIAREHFVHFLEPSGKALADKIYNDSAFFILPNYQNAQRHKLILSRHDTVNKRIKQFRILTIPFRHNLSKHKICFHSVINLTQLVIANEQPLFCVYQVSFNILLISKMRLSKVYEIHSNIVDSLPL